MKLLPQGYIDICQQTVIAGWAVDDGDDGVPATVEIFLNDDLVGSVTTSIPRNDVSESLNVPVMCGFNFTFHRAIGAADKILVRLAKSKVEIQVTPHNKRIQQLMFGIETNVSGLELGALDRPFLTRPVFNVSYVDHASQIDLLEKYKINVGSNSNINATTMVPVDIEWKPDRRLIDCTDGRLFNYALASQVMEHVANPIGWLNNIAECLKSGGRINLSLPDMRYTFDHCRTLSSAADIIDAHIRQLARPTFRSVFDHMVNVSPPPHRPSRSSTITRQAYEVAIFAENGGFVDVHCHVWTYESFLDIWDVVESLGISRVKIDRSWPRICENNEFIVSFLVV